MQSWHRPVEISVRGLRWGWPWICVLATSTSIAYAMLVVLSTGTPGSIGPFAGDNACATSGRMLYVGLNTWIPAEPSVDSCQNDWP